MSEKLKNYKSWLNEQNIKDLTPKQEGLIDLKFKKIIKDELQSLKSMSVAEFNLYHKYHEVKEYLQSVSKEDIDEVKNLIYKPTSLDDYINIEPELIFVKDEIEIPITNIHGEINFKLIKHKTNYLKHWQILRTLVSSSRNDLTLGRAVRFLVIDKSTQKYLGVICVSSGLATIKCLNDEIGWNIDKEFSVGGKLHQTINIQVCVGVQPAGRLFLLGKLLALLSLSDVVLNKFKELYNEEIVEVHTTSLYGDDKDVSQYDNLQPYFSSRLGLTAGTTALKPTNNLHKSIMSWVYQRYPYQYYLYNIDKKDSNSPMIRDKKNRLLIQCFKRLGFHRNEYFSKHRRGVYHSYIFTNSKDYLCSKITENELIKAFDNDVTTLTNFWKFGSLGNFDEIPQELVLKYKNKTKRLETVVRLKSGVRGHIENLKKKNVSLDLDVDSWYEDCSTKSWSIIKKKYLNTIGR